MEELEIECPNCKIKIHEPFMRGLKAKAIEEADLAEISAREELQSLKSWLFSASLWNLIKYWRTRHDD